MRKSTILTILAVLFVASGMAGLVYQVIWFKYLSLFLGNTTYAQAILIATFMAGLAIGAYWWGKKADRTASPLRLFAYLEIGVGFYCLAYPTFVQILEGLFISTIRWLSLPVDAWTILPVKMLVSALSLLFPTILMGGTLPLLVKFTTERIEESGSRISTLYFLNSFGAVVGALMGGFFLIEAFGLRLSIYTMTLVNLTVGWIALVISNLTIKKEKTSKSPAMKKSAQQVFSDQEGRLAFLAAAGSGVASMIYEIGWVRMLIPVIGSTIYAFSLMLASFILGIALGSWLISAFAKRIKRWFSLLALCQLGTAVVLLLSLPFYERLPYLFWKYSELLSRTDDAYVVFLAIQLLLSFSVMILPTILLGMNLPVAARIASRSLPFLGTSVGNVFSVNGVGTVIGSLLGGLILIPLLGIRGAMEIGVLVNLGIGFLILFQDKAFVLRRWVVVGTVALMGLFYLLFLPDWNKTVMLSGIFRRISVDAAPPKSFARYREAQSAMRVVYYKEGAGGTVGVTESSKAGVLQRSLLINGKPDASSSYDMPTQVMLGQIPLLLHQQADTALVIGLGSGVTVGTMLAHPIRHLDCVEILPEVVEASRFFDDVNGKPLDDARVRLVVEDAITYLKLSDSRYDVIVSEPSNPWIAGIGNIFSVEFFELCKDRLKDNGLMVQWFQRYEMSDEAFDLVLRTFQSVFPYTTLWHGIATDAILVGSNKPLSLDVPALEARLQSPRIKSELSRIDVNDVPTFLTHQILSERALARYIPYGQLSTGEHPRLEYLAARGLFIGNASERIKEFDERLMLHEGGLLLRRYLQQRQLTKEQQLNIARLHLQNHRGLSILSYSILQESLKKYPRDPEILSLFAEAASFHNRMEESIEALKRLNEIKPRDPDVLVDYAWKRFTHERSLATSLSSFDESFSIESMKRAIELSADTVDRYRIQLGDMYFAMQKYRQAYDEYRKAIVIRNTYARYPKTPDNVLYYQAARALDRLEEDRQALWFLGLSLMLDDQFEPARDLAFNLEMRRRNANQQPTGE